MKNVDKSVRRLSLKEARSVASQLAAEFLSKMDGRQFDYSVIPCSDPMPVGKTPSRWIVVAVASDSEPASMIDGEEMFISVDLISKKVSWAQIS